MSDGCERTGGGSGAREQGSQRASEEGPENNLKFHALSVSLYTQTRTYIKREGNHAGQDEIACFGVSKAVRLRAASLVPPTWLCCFCVVRPL